MIRKITLFLLMPSLIIALFLALAGVHSMPFDTTMYSFFVVVTQRFNNFKIQIPNIPHIPSITGIDVDTHGVILKVLVSFVNAIVWFMNRAVDFLNFGVLLINTIVALIEYVVVFIVSLKDLKDILLRAQELAVPVVVSL